MWAVVNTWLCPTRGILPLPGPTPTSAPSLTARQSGPHHTSSVPLAEQANATSSVRTSSLRCKNSQRHPPCLHHYHLVRSGLGWRDSIHDLDITYTAKARKLRTAALKLATDYTETLVQYGWKPYTLLFYSWSGEMFWITKQETKEMLVYFLHIKNATKLCVINFINSWRSIKTFQIGTKNKIAFLHSSKWKTNLYKTRYNVKCIILCNLKL